MALIERIRSDRQIFRRPTSIMKFSPVQLPDEIFYSLLARIAIQNNMSVLEVVTKLFSKKSVPSIIDADVDLKRFSEVTDGFYGSPMEILSSLTTFPLRARLGEIDAEIIKQFEAGYLRLSLGVLTFGVDTQYRWKFCTECVAEDLEVYGVSYWCRSQQIPTSIMCPKHGLHLIAYVAQKKKLHDRFFLPHHFMTELGPSHIAPRPNSFANYYGFEEVLVAALQDKEFFLPQSTIQSVFRDRLAELGLLNCEQKTATWDCFINALRLDAQALILLEHMELGKPSQLLFGIHDKKSSIPFARLILVSWLFGTWQAFKRYCLWHFVLDSGNLSSEESAKQSVRELCSVHRRICLDYISSCVNPTRLGFKRTAQLSSRWLLHFDREWFEHVLPVVDKSKRQKKLFE